MLDFSRLKSVADISRIHAADRPGAVELDFKDRTTSFGELDAHASRVAHGLLELGLKPGDRIGYLGKNIDRYFEAGGMDLPKLQGRFKHQIDLSPAGPAVPCDTTSSDADRDAFVLGERFG